MPALPLIYLDYNATTPVDQQVLEYMLPFFSDQFANASSTTHFPGRLASEVVELSRRRTASLIGADPSEIIFTSGSTEAINLALKGAAESYAKKGSHIITWKTEHKAVLDTCSYLEKKGLVVTVLKTDREGLPDLDELKSALRPDTILVSMMLANNETGVINPVRAAAEICKANNTLLFCDATQAPGKLLIDVKELNIDLMSISAHKMYGPKGTGALYVRRKNPRVSLIPLIHGGGHEKGLRSGTLNVPGIAGMGMAAEICSKRLWDDGAQMSKNRTIIEQILTTDELGYINGSIKNRLPNTTNIRFNGIKASALITAIPGIAVATGSACTSALQQPSHVLTAMGLTQEEADASLRISVGRYTKTDDVINAAEQIRSAVTQLRK